MAVKCSKISSSSGWEKFMQTSELVFWSRNKKATALIRTVQLKTLRHNKCEVIISEMSFWKSNSAVGMHNFITHSYIPAIANYTGNNRSRCATIMRHMNDKWRIMQFIYIMREESLWDWTPALNWLIDYFASALTTEVRFSKSYWDFL